MDIELITIGTELLLGFTVDTNGAWLGRALAARGVRVVRRTSVADDAAQIRDAIGAALARTGAVLTTGGLGPTRDDVTKQVIAELFDAPLEFHQGVWDELERRYARLGRTLAALNRNQAEVPRGAVVLPNRAGTAPGLWLEGARGLAIVLPGVPREMMGLMEDEVLPRLAGRGHGRVIRSRTVRTTLIPESNLAERLGDIETVIAPLTLAYLPGIEGVDLRVTAWDLEPDEADARLATAVASLRERAGEWVYAEGDGDLAAVVLAEAERQQLTVGTAESCTGGLIGGRLTAIPGSSRAFRGGIIAYDNAIKSQVLHVDPALIAAHGAVSEEVARAMARGAREALGVDAAVSVTGIAGPEGGSEAKPVGTVWIGLSVRDREEAVRYVLVGSRGEIRSRAAQACLFRLWRMLGD